MENRKPKIAVIGLKGLPAFGGAATVGESIIEQLKYKYDFTVYSVSSHTNQKTGKYKGVCQIVFNDIRYKRLNTLVYYIKSVVHIMLFSNYDLVHIHHNDSAFLFFIIKLKYKLIVTTHGVHNSGLIDKWIKYKWFFQGQIRFLKLADEITCVSRTEKELLQKEYNYFAHFIPNGVKIFNDIPVKESTYDIFFGASRIMRDKGADLLLRALNRINFKGKVIIAGDFSQIPEYKKELDDLSNNLNVKFVGIIKDKLILMSLIKSSRLFVFPSLKEAMSMMLLEGATTGIPIICSDIKENKDLFSDQEVLFFSSGNEVELAKKIDYSFINYNEMLEKAKAAFKKVQTKHNWKLIAEKYGVLYDKLITKESLL